MPGLLLTTASTDDRPAHLVHRAGRIAQRFDHRTQDSGNVSWVVETGDGTFFVKTAGDHDPGPAEGPTPYLDHAGRVRLLRNAVELARSCEHPCLARLVNVIETPLGPALVYEYASGELVGASADHRLDPRSAYQRFAHLPAEQLLGHFDRIIGVHQRLAQAGWIASDLYDGSMLVDFTTDRITLVDLDSYHRGAGINTMGRRFGARRFMAPEELELGAPLDQRTTVYTLGRLIWHFGTRVTERADRFCGTEATRAVVLQAVSLDRLDRFPTVDGLAAAWSHTRDAC